MIIVQSKRRKIVNILKDYPNAIIIDVTSKGTMPYLKFSPFYPIGNIPVPFSENSYAESMEGIWQGLKVFEKKDVDLQKFRITSMKGLKRTVRKYGIPLGHRKGINGQILLDYITARKQIYIPTYNWILENKLATEMSQLKALTQDKTVVLLDYETNGDVEDGSKPLSHAQLIKVSIETIL